MPPRSFRMLCSPAQVPVVRDLLLAQGYVIQPDPFFPLAFQAVEQPRPLGASAAAAFGLIYIQDRSSMLSPLFLAPPAGAAVLDMCASPGSKTGLLAQLVGLDGLVLANEPNDRRLATLRQNMRDMNLAQVVTCQYPGQKLPWPERGFSHVLLDPPCSGWGTAQRHPRIREIWPEHKLKPLIALQRRLLLRASQLLAPGGRLLYSTCTTNPAENQEQIEWAVRNLDLQCAPLAPLPEFGSHLAGQPDCPGCLHVDPDAGAGQGFFFAALVPSPRGQFLPDSPPAGESGFPPEKIPEKLPGKLPGKVLNEEALCAQAGMDHTALPPGNMCEFNNRVIFIPARAKHFPAQTHWHGCELGRLHGGNLHPHSHCRLLVASANPEIGLHLEDVSSLEKLLQGQSLPWPHQGPGSTPSGRAPLYWRGLPLGWVTIKGSRCLWSPR
jgi:16S rRNA C967 or C1407 C5-methylase (RsmB/RsmF family)